MLPTTCLLALGITFLNILQTISASSSASNKTAFAYGITKVRGVNLGGWFVLEPWITPSLFSPNDTSYQDVIDEYTFSNKYKQSTFDILSDHWRKWYTETDFKNIAAAGLNHVRIPIGYWAINPIVGDPYVQGQLCVLDDAIKWARSANLKVMLDLHGAPGSQNGFDNSGHAVDHPMWLSGNTTADTLTAIRKLVARYSNDSDVVTSIEVLNEPRVDDLVSVQKYYSDAISLVPSNQQAVFHDAFNLDRSIWDSLNPGALLDTHPYSVFDPALIAYNITQRVDFICENGPSVKKTKHKLLFGEWSGAITDCAKYLNGRNKANRYEGKLDTDKKTGDCGVKSSGTVAALSAIDKENIARYIEAQLDAYEQGAGWLFWTWKTEGAPEWDMQALIQGGLFPQPFDKRKYPGRCSKNSTTSG